MVPMTGTSPEDNRLLSPNQQGRNLAWSGHSSHAGRQAAGGRGWRPQAGMPPVLCFPRGCCEQRAAPLSCPQTAATGGGSSWLGTASGVCNLRVQPFWGLCSFVLPGGKRLYLEPGAHRLVPLCLSAGISADSRRRMDGRASRGPRVSVALCALRVSACPRWYPASCGIPCTHLRAFT